MFVISTLQGNDLGLYGPYHSFKEAADVANSYLFSNVVISAQNVWVKGNGYEIQISQMSRLEK